MNQSTTAPQRLIALKFSVEGRELGSTVAEAQKAIAPLIEPPLLVEWSGEFEQMEEAEQRLMLVVPLSFALVVIMLYLAFMSLRDVAIVLANVMTLVCGGVLGLLVMGMSFSVSAAVGFISIFGVAIMNGLILISSIHRLRLRSRSLEEAVMEGSTNRLRPMLMTILTAILGLLPAALSTRIGAQSQQPLAVVVIGGMLMSLLLNQHLTPVLYFVFVNKLPPRNQLASASKTRHVTGETHDILAGTLHRNHRESSANFPILLNTNRCQKLTRLFEATDWV